MTYPLSGIGWIALHKNEYLKAKGFFERVLSICGTGSAAPAAGSAALGEPPQDGADKCMGEEMEPLADAQFGLAIILGTTPRSADRDRALQFAQEAYKFFRTQKSVHGKKMLKETESWLRDRGVKVD